MLAGSDHNDTLIGDDGWNGLAGGTGNDTISAHVNSHVTGTRGNDHLTIGDNSVIHFSKGDGQDVIDGYFSHATVKLGPGFSEDDTSVKYDGNGIATISFGNGSDAIRVNLFGEKSLTLAYDDGSTREVVSQVAFLQNTARDTNPKLAPASPKYSNADFAKLND